MADTTHVISNLNDTLPAAKSGYDNIEWQVNRGVTPPNISACVPRADVDGERYGTIIFDGSGNPSRFLGADGDWHDMPSGSLPAGGTTGQVLKKQSNDDYDVDWGDDEGGSAANEDYQNWFRAEICRDRGAIAYLNCTGTTSGGGVSTIFDDGLPKFYATSGGSTGDYYIASVISATANYMIYKFNPRTRFIFDMYYRGLATDGPMIAYYGLTSETSLSGTILRTNNPSSYKVIAICADTSTDTTWQAVVSNGTSCTKVDTGIALDQRHKVWEIRWNLGFTSIDFLYEGTVVATISTNLPSASDAMAFFMGHHPLDTTNRSLRCGFMRLLQTMKAA